MAERLRDRTNGIAGILPAECMVKGAPSFDDPDNLRRTVQLARREPWYRLVKRKGMTLIPRYSPSLQKIVIVVGTATTIGAAAILGYNLLQKRHREQGGKKTRQ
ncbi:MAG: hypothetical protein Q8R11_00145 [bacterium]|nr:hypothetical protein [bacterium]